MSAAPWHVEIHPEDNPTDRLSVVEFAHVTWAAVAWTAILWVAAVLLTGCSALVPEPKYTDLEHPCPYARSEIGLVDAVLLDSWHAEFGEDVVGFTDGVLVQCEPARWETSAGPASGQTFDEHTVRIAYRGGDVEGDWKLRNTALAHELIHVVLWRRDGDPDDAHEQAYWTLERSVRLRLGLLDD